MSRNEREAQAQPDRMLPDARLVNSMRAELKIPSNYPLNDVNEQTFIDALRCVGVVMSPRLVKAVRSFTSLAQKAPDKAHMMTYEGIPAVDGIDEHIEWDAAEDGSVKGAIRFVQPGQRLGRIVPATAGSDGLDLAGRLVPARKGRPQTIAIDESIERSSDGALLARIAGAIRTDSDRTTIRCQHALAPDVVTGPDDAEYAGDVIIHQTPATRLVLCARGDVIARAAIEAGEIRTGRDLVVVVAMIGRPGASIQIGRDLIGRHLDHVAGVIARDLKIVCDVTNCQLEVHGDVIMPDAAFIGGKLSAAGKVLLGEVGNAAGAQTIVELGCLHETELNFAKAQRRVDELIRQVRTLEQQIEQTTGARPTDTVAHRELLTEMMCRCEMLRTEMKQTAVRQNELHMQVNGTRMSELRVERRIHPGVLLRIAGKTHQARQVMPGPLWIGIDVERRVIARVPPEGAATPLTRFMEAA